MKQLDRIKKLVSFIPENVNKIIDVGCDHGYFGCMAIKQKATKEVVFCDISDKCLEKAKNNVQKYGYSDVSNFKVVDGIPNEHADLIAINGLGGLAIIEILKNKKNDYQYFLLQPMTNVYELRKFLIEEKYNICVDKVIEVDKRFYYVLLINGKCESIYNEEELLLGKDIVKFPKDYKDFLYYRLKITNNALANCNPNMLKLNVNDSVLNILNENQLINRLLKEIGE